MTGDAEMNLEEVIADLVDSAERRFYGKYRGFVVDNNDPAALGRLKVLVPSVLRTVVSGWATPCVPYGGAADRGLLFVPEKDAGVWIEFEEGDLEFPIWTGTFWSTFGAENELPRPNNADGAPAVEPQLPPTCKIIKTAKGHTMQFEDADGKESIRLHDAVNGNRIVMDANGVLIADGTGNIITSNAVSGSISLEANGDITIKARGNLTLQATGDINLTAASGRTGIEMTNGAVNVT